MSSPVSPGVFELVNTSAIGALMRSDPIMLAWLASRPASQRVVTCPTVRAEVLFGIERRRRSELERLTNGLFLRLPCEPTPPSAGDRCAKLKATQRRLGLVLDENDLWIAATALAMDATLVTLDSDFQRVSGLRLAP